MLTVIGLYTAADADAQVPSFGAGIFPAHRVFICINYKLPTSEFYESSTAVKCWCKAGAERLWVHAMVT